jgi:hypothetical protein
MSAKALWERGQRGWPEESPVVQLPNPPLLVAFGGWLVAAQTDGSAQSAGRGVFYAGLAAWAWGELAEGANWVRRALGVAGFAFVIVRLARLLES